MVILYLLRFFPELELELDLQPTLIQIIILFKKVSLHILIPSILGTIKYLLSERNNWIILYDSDWPEWLILDHIK